MAINRRQFLQRCSIAAIAGTPALGAVTTHIAANPTKRTVKFYISEVDDFLRMKCPGLKAKNLEVGWIRQHLLVKDDAALMRKFFQTKDFNEPKCIYCISAGCDNYGPWRIVENSGGEKKTLKLTREKLIKN